MAGQPVAGVQQVWLSLVEQTSPAAQLPVQLTGRFVHGSVKLPQKPAGHVFGLQHVLWSVPPSAPHCVPGSAAQVVSQVYIVPLHGSVQVAPQ